MWIGITRRIGITSWIERGRWFSRLSALAMAWIVLFALPSHAVKHDGDGVHTVRVGFFENRPKNYTDESGHRAGFFTAILEEIARRESWQLVYVECIWTECLTLLEEGKIDLLPDVAISPERRTRFDFHQEAVLDSWGHFYNNRHHPMESMSDVNGHRIAMHKGHLQRPYLEQMAKGLGYQITVIETSSDAEAFALVAEGEADAVVANHIFGNFYYRQYGLEKSPVVLAPVSLYFATDYGANAELLRLIDLQLLALKTDTGSVYYSELEKLMQKPLPDAMTRHLLIALALLTTGLLLALLGVALLRWQVKRKTRELINADCLLRESEEKFRVIFMSQSAVKLIIEPGTGRIIEANPAAVKFYGWPREVLKQMRIQDISTSTEQELIEKCCKKINAKAFEGSSDGCIRFLDSHRLANKTIRDVEVFGSLIHAENKPSHHYFVYDITEHVQMEERLQQAQKMESVGLLAGGIAHDFNNVLGAVLGYAELAMDKLEEAHPVHANLQEIRRAAQRSAGIVRQLLAFARKQHGTPVVMNLNDTLEKIHDMLRHLLGEDIEFLWKPDSHAWLVKMDQSQVEQMAVNLCINARDAIHSCKDKGRTGRLVIETRQASFDQEYCAANPEFLPGDFVLLSVEDSGCGMDKEILQKVFEPFFTTKGEGEGSGLGLSMVYGIVMQSNGFIRVYSEPGKGTTFRIYLPRCTAAEVEAAPEAAAPAEAIANPLSPQETLVLLVDDDLMMREVVQMQLEKLGYRVLGTDTAMEAIRVAGENRKEISLLITDVVMPGMNGRDLARKILEICPQIEVLFMSGFTADEIVRRDVLEAGVNFIQKPFSRQELAEKICKILNG